MTREPKAVYDDAVIFTVYPFKGYLMDRSFKGRAKRLDDVDIPRIGHQIGVGEDELHAFMDVEAAGSPWDKAGRPKMLFEPHVFYRMLGKGAKRDRAVKEGLAYAKWGARPYPSDSYPRLILAMAIDEDKALMSASWGLTQILAQWHAACGYATPQAMVAAFMDDAENHLDATVKLLVAWKIDDDLRAHRWVEIAKVWNGPAHARHDYAGRMKRAFDKWRKIRDTPWSPGLVETPAAPSPAPAEPKTDDPVPQPAPKPPVPPVAAPEAPAPAPQAGKAGFAAALIAVAAGAAAYLANLPCDWLGYFCGG